MHPYARPPIDAPVFRDGTGQVIEYGNRWCSGSPPDDSYSVDTNLERFRPLHIVAEALIDHLVSTYDVTVSEGHDDDILHARTDIVRATRIIPRDPTAAPLTFMFTSYPSVIVHPGVLSDFLYPVCGCDACDSSWEYEAEEMEWHVLAVAAGKFTESMRRGWVGDAIEAVDGMKTSSTNGRSNNLPRARLRAAASALDALPNGWVAWPL
jgi:hypothetical protein